MAVRGGSVEASSTSDILICDYLVSQGKVREFGNLITVANMICGKHSHNQSCRIIYGK